VARLPECIRPLVVEHMGRICRAGTFADRDDAIAAMFAACLPGMLSEYGDLFIDSVDREQAVTSYLPATLASWLADLVDIGVGRRLYPAHVCDYISAAMREAAGRLDRTITPLAVVTDDGAIPPDPKQTAYLVILLEEAARDFAATVLIGGPAPMPTTADQRREARRRRLTNYVRFQRRVKGLKENLCSICRAAGVPRKGRGSAARWIDGTLPDSSKTARLIEAVLDFRLIPPLQSPTAVGSHLGHEFIE
jgi:hypothetical protein